MRAHALLLLLTVAALGCGQNPEMRLLGNWSGEFDAGSPAATLKGYLQLYNTDHKFKLHLSDNDQTFDTLGSWSLKGSQILLSVVSIQAVGMTLKEGDERRKPYFDPTLLRQAYGHLLVLNLTPDRTHLEGERLSIGKLSGRHVFERPPRGSYEY